MTRTLEDERKLQCESLDAAPITVSPSHVDCTSVLGWMGAPALCYAGCPARGADAVARAAKALDVVEGQDFAVNEIKWALASHTWDRPLVLHFVGDNGVGKTFSAVRVAQALAGFGGDGDPGAFLQLNGEDYATAADGRELAARVREALGRCASTLVLVDEVQKMRPEVLAALEPLLDGAVPGSRQAVVVLTSDFGAEGFTAGMSRAQLDALVRDNVRDAWKSRPRLLHFLTRAVPFRTLSGAALAAIAARAISAQLHTPPAFESGLRRICFDPALLPALARAARRKYAHENARGALKVVSEAVAQDLAKTLYLTPGQECIITLVRDSNTALEGALPHIDVSCT